MRGFCRFFAGFLLLGIMLSFLSCAEEEDALSLMREFADAYGEGTVYSPRIPEGETGHMSGDFFAELYETEYFVPEDMALLLLPSLTRSGEAGLLCFSNAADAMAAEELCLSRLRTLCTAAALAGRDLAADSFVRRYGRTVVYAALPDGERALALFDRLL